MLTLVLAGIAVTAWPPAVAPDGGWPLADTAAGRVLAAPATSPSRWTGSPSSRTRTHCGSRSNGATLRCSPQARHRRSGVVVIVCDPVFDEVTGAACGSDAEDAWLARTGRTDLGLVDRFEAGPRRVISVYAAGVP